MLSACSKLTRHCHVCQQNTNTHLTFCTYMDATSQPINIKLETGSLIKTYTKETKLLH
jgi:hypothetical protein